MTSCSVISRWPQWSRNASFSASRIARRWPPRRAGSRDRRAAARPGSSSSPSRRIRKKWRTGSNPARVRSATLPTEASSVHERELDVDARILDARPAPSTLDAPVEQPPADAAAPEIRVDLALDLVHRGVVADHPLDVLRAMSRPSTSTRTTSSKRSLPSFVSMSICRFGAVGARGRRRRVIAAAISSAIGA